MAGTRVKGGLSPRGRGEPAGLTSSGMRRPIPAVCGEPLFPQGLVDIMWAYSPPRVRGSGNMRWLLVHCFPTTRPIPACAGSRSRHMLKHRQVRDGPVHPRVCGEQERAANRIRWAVRHPRRAHPRVCGESLTARYGWWRVGRTGLSPRVRGRPCSRVQHVARLGPGYQPRVCGGAGGPLVHPESNGVQYPPPPRVRGSVRYAGGQRPETAYPRVCGGAPIADLDEETCCAGGPISPACAGELAGAAFVLRARRWSAVSAPRVRGSGAVLAQGA